MELPGNNDEIFQMLQAMKYPDECKSMVRRFYDADVHAKCKDRKTKMGGTVGHCIVSAAVERTCYIGFMACDPEAYEVFSPLTDPIVREYHKVPENKPISHPPADYGDLNKLPFDDLDPEGKYVLSTRVRVGRTAAGYCGPPLLSKEGRNELEARGKAALESLPSEYKGKYFPLLGMSKETQQQLIDDHFLFGDANDIYNLAAGVYRHWPEGRGIYFNNDRNFLVWINEEDHFRLISMEKGGNLARVYKRLIKAIQLIEKKIPFARSNKLGNLTTCPTNLGTSLRASVHAKIPKLDSNQSLLNAICDKYGIQPRGTGGEHTANVGGVYDLSNKQRLGITEVAAVKLMADGVKLILQKEAELPECGQEQIGLDMKITHTADEMFEILQKMRYPEDCKHMVRKYYDADVHTQCKGKKTPLGGTIEQCIVSGVVEPSCHIAFMACDADAYETFAPLSDKIVRDYHKIPDDKELIHPPTDFGDLDNLPFGDIDPEKKYVLSTRVRVGRTCKGYLGTPCISKESRDELEARAKAALESLPNEYNGKYYPLKGMDKDTQKRLVDEHFLFGDANDKFNAAAGVYRHWPDGRGIFFNDAKNFLVWVNEEDHFRLISMEKGGDLKRTYTRLVKAIQLIEKSLPFATSPRLGNLSVCPSNLGTSLRASVHAKIPKLDCNQSLLNDICDKYGIQPRGTGGEHTANVGGVYDLSNKQRLGISEVAAVKLMADGVKLILQKEAELPDCGQEQIGLDMKITHTADEMFEILQKMRYPEDCKHMVRKYYDADVHAQCKGKKTPLGGTIEQCIVSGVVEPSCHIAFMACDADAYETFAPLSDKIVRDYHKIPDDKELIHPPTDFGDLDNLPFGDIDPEKKYVLSTRVRVGRTCKGYLGTPCISKESRDELEARAKAALESLPNEYNGKYYPLKGMDKDTQKRLVDEHFLFGDANDKFNAAAGVYRHWPDGRGIFFNDAKNFLVWVNEEDHFRLISMEKGGDLKRTYTRLVKAIQLIEKSLPFATSPRLGNLSVCPSNLGTSLRASVHAKIPKLDCNQSLLNDICDKYGIQPRGTGGEHTANVGGVYDLSNKQRLGISEVAAVKLMADGVKLILQKEAELPDCGQEQIGLDMKITHTADEMFEILQKMRYPEDCKHMVRKYYDADVHAQCKGKKTPLGGTIEQCIVSGVVEPSCYIAFMACDAEAYETFAPLSDKIVRDYHKIPDDKELIHPPTDFGDLDNLPFEDIDPEKKYVLSTRVRVGRTCKGYLGTPCISKESRDELEARAKAALESLPNEYNGKYYPLKGMDKDTQKRLVDEHFLFGDANDKFNAAAGVYRHWPDGRGIFFNDAKNFLVWVNEEDHFRLISMEKGGDLKRTYTRLVKAIQLIEKSLPFATSPRLGNLSVCPSNLGTSLRAYVHAKIPLLGGNKKMLDEICDQYGIQPRGTFGEHTENVGGVFDLSNKQRLGISEVDAVKLMFDGVKAILAKEAELEGSQ